MEYGIGHDHDPAFARSAFNQPIGKWNTVSLTNMWETFYCASAFDQPSLEYIIRHEHGAHF